MFVCLCVICAPPSSFCSKSTLVECLPFGCFLPRSHVTCCPPSLACLFDQLVCSAFISNKISLYVCVLLCVCGTYTVNIGVCMRVHAPSSFTPLFVFYLFSFPATAWSNECLSLILLSPSSSSSSSSFTRLFPFLLCGLFGFFCLLLVLLLHLVYFYFASLLPPLPPLPPFLWHSELG